MRERFANRFEQLFRQVDVIAYPSMRSATLPNSAIPPDAGRFKESSPVIAFSEPFNMSRIPTLSMPGGAGNGAPPPSLVGPLLGEAALIGAGAA